MQQIKHVYLTQAQYNSATKDQGTLYFTSDTNRIYKGTMLFAAAKHTHNEEDLNISELECGEMVVNGHLTVDGTPVSLEGHTHTATEIANWSYGNQLNAASKRVLNVATPTSSTDGVNKSYVDNKFTNATTPTSDTAVANKKYVDDAIQSAITNVLSTQF